MKKHTYDYIDILMMDFWGIVDIDGLITIYVFLCIIFFIVIFYILNISKDRDDR